MQQVHNLPQPRQGGFEWPELEAARAKYNHIRKKAREIEAERYQLESEIKRHIDRDTSGLAESWLSGEEGEAEDPRIRKLQEKKRELERREMALRNVAIPRVESEVAQVIGQSRLIWQEEIWASLPGLVEAAQRALTETVHTVQGAFHPLTVALSLLEWTNSGNPLSYAPPSGVDRTIGESFGRLHEALVRVESRIAEHEALRGGEPSEAREVA